MDGKGAPLPEPVDVPLLRRQARQPEFIRQAAASRPIAAMVKIREVYVCSACNARFSQWKGQCSTCGEWNSLEPLQLKTGKSAVSPLSSRAEQVMRLADAGDVASAVFSTGMDAFDRVLANCLVPESPFPFGGEPGLVKSTFFL